jgi:hypothetical protein
MSASAWDRLSEWMVSVALTVDHLKVAIFWTLLLAVVIWLAAWFLKVLSCSSLATTDDQSSELPAPTLLERCEERACIAISRRPRRRTRRHHRRHVRTVSNVV